MSGGSLMVVGTGFVGAGHVTPEALAHMDEAEKLFYLGGDPPQRLWLQDRNPSLESLYDSYRVGGDRRLTYAEMVARILAPVRQGRRVCAAFYGHPGVFVYPSHEAIRQARAEGYPAAMLPGVSAEDCLFADLGMDPARAGCQSYEASYFLLRPPRFSSASALILWQVGAVGVVTFHRRPLWGKEGLRVLVDRLRRVYPADHEVVAYEASNLPIRPPSIVRVPLRELPRAGVTVITTLYIPPLRSAPLDRAMTARLGMGPGRNGARGGRSKRTEGAAASTGGRLMVVGAGYSAAGQVTAEAQGCIEDADRVFYLLRDPITAAWLRELNPHATSLHGCFKAGAPVAAAFEAMVERIVAAVRAGRRVCAVFYGHPAVLAPAAHESVRRVRALDRPAQLLPGISVADNLFADLGVDPGTRGCQLYEATDFLVRRRGVENGTPLILLQVGAVGMTRYRSRTQGNRQGFRILVERLGRFYPEDHPVTLYEISQLPTHEPRIETRPLREVGNAALSVFTTMYVAPARELPPSEEMVRRLRMASRKQ